MIRSVATSIVLYFALCVPVYAQQRPVGVTQCSPIATDYTNLPELFFLQDYTPDDAPDWQSAAKRVDLYGREIAPAANALGNVASAARFSEDLGYALDAAARTFWSVFDQTGAVPDSIKDEYAYYIVKVWRHNSNMAGLYELTGGADAGLITGTASVQLPHRWEQIPSNVGTQQLLNLAVRADYLSLSQCAYTDDSLDGQIASTIRSNLGLGDWDFAARAIERMGLSEFADNEKQQIIEILIDAGRAGEFVDLLNNITSPEALRALFSRTFIDREREALQNYLEEYVFHPWGMLPLWSDASKYPAAGPGAHLLRAIRRFEGWEDDKVANQLYGDYIQARLGAIQFADPSMVPDQSVYSRNMKGVAAFECADSRAEEAVFYIFDRYPLLFANERDLGLEGVRLNPISTTSPLPYAVDDRVLMSPMRVSGKPPRKKRIENLAFELAYVGCSSGMAFDADDPVITSILSHLAYRSAEVKRYVDMESSEKSSAYRTEKTGLIENTIRKYDAECLRTYNDAFCACKSDEFKILANAETQNIDSDVGHRLMQKAQKTCLLR